ncbi:hypothetical protein K437DRAFT_253065 [Tilletiaria anomala UBC 951]|uniref:Uncharacterized protein n=1 Tax=Tilletiaria anomala (strain ATCC 24038 / CBS 436.72 / UBC 951) TaxID=1037660 RepID=A0A066WRV1_TILAU|nr:uncharacterized protein K437DRAFT_253065 [Tilletiaria anomala UBC 951]KDN53370.1 hypothetical protein K437DRAFT_253065 [Tilletiaria anomala UBC 951]
MSSSLHAATSSSQIVAVATTRLDRLVSLLETGSTLAVKQTAAQQLGQIAALSVRGGGTGLGAGTSAGTDATAGDAGVSSALNNAGGGTVKSEKQASQAGDVERQEAQHASGSNIKLEDLSAASATAYHGLDGDWHESVYLLAKVLPHLRSKSWDTRVAAASAIEVICRASGVWDVRSGSSLVEDGGGAHQGKVQTVKKEEADGDGDASMANGSIHSAEQREEDPLPPDTLSFRTFSLANLLATGPKLLSSAGKEYILTGGSVAERLAAAKRNLKSLGLDMGGPTGVGDDGNDLGLDVEAELRAGEAQQEQQQAQSDSKEDSPSAALDREGPGLRIDRSSKAPLSSLPQPCVGLASASAASSFGSAAAAAPTGGKQSWLVASPTLASPSLSISASSGHSGSALPTMAAAAVAEQEPPAPAEVDLSKLSARERNQLKRKRKMEGKGSVAGGDSSGASTATPSRSAGATTPLGRRASEYSEKTRVVESPAAAAAGTAFSNGSVANADRLRIKSPTPSAVGLDARHSDAAAASKATNGEARDHLCAIAAPTARPSSSLQTPSVEQPTPSPEVATPVSSAKDGSALLAPAGEWPFQLVAQVLAADLFNAQWEIRHGAALGLREVIRTQGACAGMCVGSGGGGAEKFANGEGGGTGSQSASEASRNVALHGRWCEDMAIRLLSVLSLDRLGDFIFDHVVAPVRETASQTLAALFRVMPNVVQRETHACLIAMILQDYLDASPRAAAGASDALDKFAIGRGVKGYSWEVRHAGLLGLKYELALRDEAAGVQKQDGEVGTLREIVNMATLALRDEDDDIRGVAASMLIPAANEIVTHLHDMLPRVIHQLWECLEHARDDLSSSLSSIMDLLSTLMQNSVVITLMRSSASRPLPQLIPLVYPFFRHTISSVRAAAVRAIVTFLGMRDAVPSWADDRIFRLLFQNMVVEEKPDIRQHSANAWATLLSAFASDPAWLASTLGPHVTRFYAILMTPLGHRFDPSLFYRPTGAAANGAHDVDKSMLAQDLTLVGMDSIIRGRLSAAMALGEVLALWPAERVGADFESQLDAYLSSSSALQRCLAAAVLQEWAEACWRRSESVIATSPSAQKLSAKMIGILESPAPITYAEMTTLLLRTQTECQALCNMFVRDGKLARDAVPVLSSTVDPTGHDASAFSLASAKTIAGETYQALLPKISKRTQKTALPLLQQKHRVVVASIGFYETAKSKQDTQMFASVASAVIALGSLPDKLNPIIRSIMNSVKFEESRDLQERSAMAVAHLIEVCCRSGAKSNPSGKVVKNLCAFVCQDTSITPVFEASSHIFEGILSIKDASIGVKKDESEGTPEEAEGRLIRRGAQVALAAIAKRFGASLFTSVAGLWDSIASALDAVTASKQPDELDNVLASGSAQALLDGLNVLQTVLPHVAIELHTAVIELLPKLTLALQSKFAVIRSAAAQTIAASAQQITSSTMLHIVHHIIPLLNDATLLRNRQGAAEAIALTVGALDLDVLPYLIFLIVPLLGRMGDPSDDVRLLAASTFGILVKMVPLEAGLPDPVGFPTELLDKRQEQRLFLEQLLGNNKVQHYEIPVSLNVELRKYQQDGVNWMAFLSKYQLHGVLCDDMGLGKTLQSIAILASKHYERDQRYKATGSPDSKPLPSLVICPPTLTGHWVFEIRKYATNLRPLLFGGLPAERALLLNDIPKHDVIVMSYDVVRNDIASLSPIAWNYCILDEGHIIKNAKTKTTKAVKTLKANHRLLLSGTPIQNSVLELWSLFDFLMPGFLGTEKAFHERFSKPILATRDGKATAKEREAAALALEALHKQVLPFVLRRLKDDVLDDLPPKIIQDIECELGDVQRQLYDDFTKAQSGSLEDMSSGGEDGKQHVFQTLQYLRKLVNHPKLVMDDNNPKHLAIKQKLAKSGEQLQSIAHAPKLQALRQLLNDCGIGQTPLSEGEGAIETTVSQHRVLVFCQMKQMIDIIEHDLFKKHMPSVTYMRLDGSVSAEKRFDVVQTFNSDPSIDVLLLTTQVGGLGLTLTSADTVIFVEHDWNPMKDLQAMDRAHRLGQKKVVSVYRLITKNTLEAKIMGLQRFKMNLANTVVSQQNADSLEAMDTDQVLDLFNVNGDNAVAGGETAKVEGKGTISQKALLESLQSMPDAEENEYAGMTAWRG